MINLDPVLKTAQDGQSHNLMIEIKSIQMVSGEEFNLTPYLVKDSSITIERSIEINHPNNISFTIAKGYLLDPFNDDSEIKKFILKGSKIVVRIGEKVSGVDYWQNMGSYLITETSMITYERGKYPTMEIKAEDKRILWQEKEILATDYYTNIPENILSDILENEAGEDLTDIDIPVFDNSTTLYHQFVEMTIMDIIEQICNRYGYFPKITVDNKITFCKISNLNPINHIYDDTNKLLTYTPDDTFSDYTTRIIVTCEGREFQERVFPQERVLFLTGSIGFWGSKKTRQEYYSENREKRIKNPILRSIEHPIVMHPFLLAGQIKAYIKYEDPENKYVTVGLEAADLRPTLIALVVAYIAVGHDVIYVEMRAGKIIASSILTQIIYILASIANYQLEIWGNPVGYVRQSYQSEPAIDIELEALTGKQIQKKLEEPLAYNVNEAQVVANHELLILQLQRKRIKISKIAHLQDEEGDTIKVIHPYSGKNIKFFVTNLKRIVIPSSVKKENCFIDELEGWFLNG